ncbi:organic cation transporter protein [Rhipicephalus sanguineus]|uniref:organic cation transporter protein n=1 Tax=Rhipicephalus sanguineus TaxID=34632 RepID=UPI001895A936|nr:organic cation transporter protein [Rhipicephalus sanguineus]
MANAVFMAGVLGSLAASGYVTDIIGRKRIIGGATFVLMIAAFGGCFANTYVIYLCTRFVISGSSSALSMVACILLAEVSTNTHRATHVSLSAILGLLLGDTCYAVLKQARLNWIWLQLLMVAPTLLVPLGYCYLVIHESPRWLISRRNIKSAAVVMEMAAKMNGFPADAAEAVVERIKIQDLNYAKQLGASSTDRSTSSAVLRRGLIIYASSFAIMVAYYTLLLSFHDNTWIRWTSLASEAVCYALYIFVVDRISRVTLVATIYLLAGTYCCFLAPTFGRDATELLSTGLLIEAKAVTGIGVVVTSLCATEAFPSATRGLGVCLAYSCARLGGVFAATASSLRTAGREDLLLAIVGAVLYTSSQIFRKLPRSVTPFNPDSTRTTTVASPSDGLEGMKKSL